MKKYTPKLTKNKFIDYLRPHMPVGGGGIDACLSLKCNI